MERISENSRERGSRLIFQFRQSSAIGLCAISLFILAVPAHATLTNFVTNGSFENINGLTSSFEITNGGVVVGPPTTSNLPGWTITSIPGNAPIDCLVYAGTATTNPCGNGTNGTGYLNYNSTFPNTTDPDGGNFVAVDGDSRYTVYLSQTLNNLVIGGTYTLTFDQAASQFSLYSGATTEQWEVFFGSQPTQFSTVMNNPSGGFTGWFQQTLTFTADSTSDVLSFLAVGTPNGLPPVVLLDGVSVTGPSSPEPATYALMGFGLVGVFAAARRFKKRS